jgi:hypothetical protein
MSYLFLSDAPSRYPVKDTELSQSGDNRLWRNLRMGSDEWVRTLADGGRVKFTHQKLTDDWVFITAQIEGNKVVYSVVLTNEKNPVSRKEVESHFEGELTKK